MANHSTGEIIVNGEKHVRETKPLENRDGLKYALVHGPRSGVVAGYVSHVGDTVCEVHEARQLYYWNSDFLLVDLANTGPTEPEECKFSAPHPEIYLVLDACAIIDCTETAANAIQAVKDTKIEK